MLQVAILFENQYRLEARVVGRVCLSLAPIAHYRMLNAQLILLIDGSHGPLEFIQAFVDDFVDFGVQVHIVALVCDLGQSLVEFELFRKPERLIATLNLVDLPDELDHHLELLLQI